MTHNEYNGWTNYETWCVNLWMDNEEKSQDYWRDQAKRVYVTSSASPVLTKEQVATFELSRRLAAHHEEVLPELQGFAADLLNAAMSEVNWNEIAKALLADFVPSLDDLKNVNSQPE